jgi:hypothetical protein
MSNEERKVILAGVVVDPAGGPMEIRAQFRPEQALEVLLALGGLTEQVRLVAFKQQVKEADARIQLAQPHHVPPMQHRQNGGG